MALTCDGSHVHAPWGAKDTPNKFNTAEEAEYPQLLCSRMAACTVEAMAMQERERQPGPGHRNAALDPALVALRFSQASAGRQPRRSGLASLVAEFHHTILVNGGEALEAWATTNKGKTLMQNEEVENQQLPAGYKVHKLIKGGGEGACAIGVVMGRPWTPEEFMAVAKGLHHPYEAIAVDDDILRAIFNVVTTSTSATSQRRKDRLAKWRRRAEELVEAERLLKENMHPDVEAHLREKPLLLFAEMMESAGVSKKVSRRMIQRMASGLLVAGHMERSGLFPVVQYNAATPIQHLWEHAGSHQEALLASTRAGNDGMLDEEVYKSTQEEVKKGWLRGPYTHEELTKKHGRWVGARRFGVWQGASCRAIDDYSAFGHNGITSTGEKVDVGGVDVVANMVRAFMKAIDLEKKWVTFRLSTGEVLEAPLHPDYCVSSPDMLVGKLWDLASAYRQLPVDPSQAPISIIAVYNPHAKCVELYEQMVLPFGATAAVPGFNMVARGLQKVIAVEFEVVCSHYFDDYTVLELKALAQDTQELLDGVFSLLGWATKQHAGFDTVFDVLGVVCDLKNAIPAQRALFRNKLLRIKELVNCIDGYVHEQCLHPPEARRVRGRGQFASSVTFGKAAAVPLSIIGRHAESHGAKWSPALEKALVWLRIYLLMARPREVRASMPRPALVFTDGCCEPGQEEGALVGVGGVLIANDLPRPRFFGARVPDVVRDHWQRAGKQQVISQAEILPVLIAKWTWRRQLADRPAIFFIDNDGARHNLVRGASVAEDSAHMVMRSWLEDAETGTLSWYDRVPSASNISDGPSRDDFSAMSRINAVHDSVVGPDAQQDPWGSIYSFLSGTF